MAPPEKRSKLETAEEEEEEEAHGLSALPAICIPEEVIFFNILVILSSKTLAKFKCVCKSWRDFISGDPLFPLRQGRRAVSSSAATGIWCRDTSPVLLQTSGAPGIPDPRLTFVPGQCLSVCASANGLLCLQCKTNSFNEYLYICNPATKEGHVVPNFNFNYCLHHVGLAFDPINSPYRYKLVYLQPGFDSIVFKVFSSETSKWIESSQKLDTIRYMIYMFDLLNNIYVGGVLYWPNISDCMIYFDPEKDVAGTTQWPFMVQTGQALWRQSSHNIGVCKGRVTCTRFSIESGLEVWIMSSTRWEKKYHMNLERIVDLNVDVFGSYWRTKTLRSRQLLGVMTSDNYIVPLMSDGWSELYLWARKKNKVLRFDTNSGRVTGFCKNIRSIHGGVFLYANSMVPVPKLSQEHFTSTF